MCCLSVYILLAFTLIFFDLSVYFKNIFVFCLPVKLKFLSKDLHYIIISVGLKRDVSKQLSFLTYICK